MSQTTNSIINISHSLINNKNINILYYPSNTFFDKIFNEINNVNVFFDEDTVAHYYHDMYFSNNFLIHSNQTQRTANRLHLKQVVAFHASQPNNFKKEDTTILFNSIKSCYKIFFGKDVADSWGVTEDTKSKIIEYGIPSIDLSLADRTNNILIFNLENNPQINTLYQTISSSIAHTHIIKNTINLSLNNIINLLSSYKISIDFGNKINTILSAACGTECITPTEENNNPLIHKVTDYAQILNIIKAILDNPANNETRLIGANQIAGKYNYSQFETSVLDLLNNLKNNEIFKL